MAHARLRRERAPLRFPGKGGKLVIKRVNGLASSLISVN